MGRIPAAARGCIHSPLFLRTPFSILSHPLSSTRRGRASGSPALKSSLVGLLPLTALRQRGEDTLHEGRQVVGRPARDQVAIADARRILPDSARVLDIVSDREEPRHL